MNHPEVSFSGCFFIHTKAAPQITTEIMEPAGAAHPMGYRVSAKWVDAQYASGILASKMDATLWIKEIPDNP